MKEYETDPDDNMHVLCYMGSTGIILNSYTILLENFNGRTNQADII